MYIVECKKCFLNFFSSNPNLICYQLNFQFIFIFHLLFNSLPSSATYGFGIVAFDQKLYFVPNDEGTRGQLCKTEVFDLDNPDAGWRITAQMNYHRSQVLINVYVVVGISNSVLSILTASFPVRIEKRRLLQFFNTNCKLSS